MTNFILPEFITWMIASCLEPLHAPSHAPLHAPESITSITRIHCMRPVFTVVNQLAAGLAIGSGAAIAVSPSWRH
jgi:hypothetical protein